MAHKRRIIRIEERMPQPYSCQWFEAALGKWYTCTKTTENAYATYATRADAESFFRRNNITEYENV